MKKKLAYAGYIIGVTVFCLYFLFPSEAVTSYVNYRMNAVSPGVKWQWQGVKPHFPPGLSADFLELSQKDRKVIRVEQVAVTPSLFSLLTSSKTVRITGETCDGRVDATLVAAKTDAAPRLDLTAVFDDIQLSRIPALSEFKMFALSGIGAGKVAFSRNENGSATGGAQINIGESRIQLTPAMFGISEVNFKTVTADLALEGRLLTLKSLDIDSREVSGRATGALTLSQPVGKSMINITGDVTPHPGMMQKLGTQFPVDLISGMKTKTGGIPFRISGTVEQPNFSLK